MGKNGTDSTLLEEEKEIVVEGTHNYSSEKDYVPPSEPAVQKHLEWFRDQKLALMVHWGMYCQAGLGASWGLSDEDSPWSRQGVNWTDAETYKKEYYALNRSFNPIRFQPEEWAEMAAACGFRYLILTTKHHDGFCMWDTKYTNYKVTAEDCPYHTNVHADIVRGMFDAFRSKGLGIGAYFSKADWHTPYYRTPEIPDDAPTDRGPMYDPKEEPERWEMFIEFTRNQVLELCETYGPLDILWFDAGWVCKKNGQDIRLGEIVDAAREKQPWLLSADRTVGGPYENYVTPEQCVPDQPLSIPWESNLTLGTGFHYKFGDHYKSARQVVHTLVGIAAKGGNLALSVSPQPDGRIPVEAMDSLRGLGCWMEKYGEAIYGTRVCAPYQVGDVAFTKKGSTVYAIRLFPEEWRAIEKQMFIPYDGTFSKVTFLNSGEELTAVPEKGGFTVTIPVPYRISPPPIAMVFKIQ